MALEWLPKPAVFGHRGASAYAPENTLPAFDLAVEMDADAIEFDVMLTRDEQVVVIHDLDLDRTTLGTGRVPELSADEVLQWPAGPAFQDQYPEARVPLLEQVLERYGDRIAMNIELKNLHAPGDQLPQQVAKIVSRFPESVRILFSSFNPLALWRIQRLCPARPAGLLAAPGQARLWASPWLRGLVKHQALHPYLGDVTEKLVDRTQQKGRRVHVYTVNDKPDVQQMMLLGVDGLFTDDPAGTRAVMNDLDAVSR